LVTISPGSPATLPTTRAAAVTEPRGLLHTRVCSSPTRPAARSTRPGCRPRWLPGGDLGRAVRGSGGRRVRRAEPCLVVEFVIANGDVRYWNCWNAWSFGG
jgi:hypothetical protein